MAEEENQTSVRGSLGELTLGILEISNRQIRVLTINNGLI
jgi:hypothetical protein